MCLLATVFDDIREAHRECSDLVHKIAREWNLFHESPDETALRKDSACDTMRSFACLDSMICLFFYRDFMWML